MRSKPSRSGGALPAGMGGQVVPAPRYRPRHWPPRNSRDCRRRWKWWIFSVNPPPARWRPTPRAADRWRCPWAMVIISGSTSWCSIPHMRPVRPKPGLHFIGNEDAAVLAHDFRNDGEVLLRRRDEAAKALNRLHQHPPPPGRKWRSGSTPLRPGAGHTAFGGRSTSVDNGNNRVRARDARYWPGPPRRARTALPVSPWVSWVRPNNRGARR